MIDGIRIVVAADERTDVRRAMDVATGLAHPRQAAVHVLRVVPHRGASVFAGTDAGDLRDHGDAIVPRSLLADDRRTAGDLHVRSRVLEGDPRRVIPAYVQLIDASMVVLGGDYGTSRFWRSARGVDEIVRQSPVPVLVLPTRRTSGRDARRLHRILTPVDFSVASAVAMRTAMDLGRRDGARVTLLHSLTDVPRRMVFSGSEAWRIIRRLPAEREAASDHLRSTAALFGAGDVDTAVATGVAETAMLEMAARGDTDLIVMGVARRSWLDRFLFGSTLRRLLPRVPVPVLVVPVVAGTYAWPGPISPRRATAHGPIQPERVAA
ncbi:MAG: universal stress protein [Vicinamibacterales bacterium]